VIAARRVRGVGSSPTSPRRLDPALRGWVGGWEWGVGGGGGYCHHVSDVSAPVRQAAAATRPLLSPRVRRVGLSPGGRCRHATVIVTTCPTCRPQSGRPLPPRDRYCHHVSDVSAPVREAAAAMRPLRRPHVSDVAAPVRKAVADSKFTCAQPRVSFRHVRHVGHRVSGEVPRVQTTRLTGFGGESSGHVATRLTRGNLSF
jgi:hypothetical protein